MKLIDFDGLFDEKLTKFMEENKNKYTEKQWESLIPKLYQKFADTYVAKVKCTPKQYYANMSDCELVECLCAHIAQDVPTPEFLCDEIEKRSVSELLLPLLNGDSTDEAMYAINLLQGDRSAFDAYFSILTGERFDVNVREEITEIFKCCADEVKERALKAYDSGLAKDAMLEICSRVKARDERIYERLLSAFLSGEDTPMRASYLAAYGDERALPYLMNAIENKTIGFVEFQELKYAIEALGGEYNEDRDFTEDKDYLAIEAASQKNALPDFNERKS